MLQNKNILVTGGAGFIGSHLVEMLLKQNATVVVLDNLTYAGNLRNLEFANNAINFRFIRGNICDAALVTHILHDKQIDLVLHLAAESHVDNSLVSPGAFIETNINGTYNLLAASLQYWEHKGKPANFRFVHISTDEVFGQLAIDEPPFNELSPYKPNSPYSASKAASDLLVRSWYHSYKFPAIITHASNNFGPRQHGEKFIPTVIRSALSGNKIPIYGSGNNIRDWLFVQDFCRGLILAANAGICGESYCFGGGNEYTNYDLAIMICGILDQLVPEDAPYARYISFVTDRKGHDFRYAIDSSKANLTLGWQSATNFMLNLQTSVNYYANLVAESVVCTD